MQVLTHKLHPKVQEFKRRAALAPVSGGVRFNDGLLQHRKLAVGTSAQLLDKRILQGYGVPWNIKDSYDTKFVKGCCTKSIRENGPDSTSRRKIKVLWQHRQDDPLANWGLLEEDDYGLFGQTLPLDDVPSGDRALVQVRSGTVEGFSIGFNYIWDKVEWDDSDNSLVCLEIDLWEISPVTLQSNPGAYIMRSANDFDNLDDEADAWLRTLPRKMEMEGRQLLTRYKSLIMLPEPPDEEQKALRADKPVGDAIDFNYLLTNLKIQ